MTKSHLTPLHQQLLNTYQQNFPLSPTPFKDIADSLEVTEEQVLSIFQELSDQQFIARIGSVIAPNRIGVSALMAIEVLPENLVSVAAVVSQYPEVNHNYERENRFNLWFVIIARDDGHLHSVIKQIETETGHKALYLPLLADYFINLGFELNFDD